MSDSITLSSVAINCPDAGEPEHAYTRLGSSASPR